ncbi:MAG TPA: hypothetical protein DDX39_00235 [Bacteroidales bacterium]|nr:MAG: hypothetical protein A2W98_03320 [Bacteroidetes bacterium GWF2_33_38]OFY91940.1 MAG: hypothetical protein A2236_02070 [Bacteroidetes bacterium RIFOXYA2_FULL_33_7]HBF87037.1 hypothetical protein [Bacteroidales bacterium]
MKIKLTFLLLLLSLCLCAQINYQKGDTLFVWANSGLNLRETPNENGKILTTIPFGELVEIISETENEMFDVEIIKSKKINNKWTPNYSISGYLIKVNYKNITGYIYSGFLSKLEPIYNIQTLYSLNEIFEKEHGIAKRFEWGNNERINNEIIFNNGFVYYERAGNAWFQTTYMLSNVRFEEGILIVYNFIENMNKSQNGIWFIEKTKDSFLTFTENSNMYNASIRQMNNIFILTIDGSN